MSGSGDYIPREEAEKRLSQRAEIANSAYIDQTPCQIMMLAQNAVHLTPAADVRPVVRGKWIQTTQPMGWRDEDCAECSVCGEDFVLDEWAMDEFTNLMNFCPNCGADMREES